MNTVRRLFFPSFGQAVLTLLAAVVSWYAVERRFLRPERRKEIPVAETSVDKPGGDECQLPAFVAGTFSGSATDA